MKDGEEEGPCGGRFRGRYMLSCRRFSCAGYCAAKLVQYLAV